ncbi:hypothetical protein CAPTEDRAFT_150011 [Capitella teleta]|uniref:Transmembrane and coiled-coil domain-containing protein 4 n=1 Tax=Capitella teleta TaxID=283909 RepID=R7ULQ2_CAPTE|nr:hypothetical protein CAPTEDRAFT_150011 [Capitella teleta]|eukprot:ELU07125.1 hypothetical protein CAPTEDRAFT_150011 [Capitella teleta]
MLAIAKGECHLENADAFVDSLKQEKLAQQSSLQIYPQNLLIQALKDGCYDARLRVLAKYMSLLLHVDWPLMQEFEDSIMDSLQEEEHKVSAEEKKETADKESKRNLKRYALIGLATVGGGTLIGLTGGLAAPFIAAGAGAIIGGAGAAALGSTVGIAIIGSLFGVAGAGLTGYKMKKRVGGIEEFEFEPLSEGRQLHVTIAVSGWLAEDNPGWWFYFKAAWKCLASSREQYVLRFESKYLKELGKAINYLYQFAINTAAQEALKYTVLQGLLAAVAWPATLLTAASVIDNPWSVCTSRSINVGRQLANVLLSREQGKRPVTLIGFSLGARVIFYCLEEMAKRKNCEGIIEDVILLGAPVTGHAESWQPFEKVVSGRIVNGYCKGDWLLKFLYRTTSVQMSIAGLQPVKWDNRRMHNIDLSDVVNGHLDYMAKIQDILNVVSVTTKVIPKDTSTDSLRKWVQIHKGSSTNAKKQPLLAQDGNENLHEKDLEKEMNSHAKVLEGENGNPEGELVADIADIHLDSQELTKDKLS